MDVDEGVVRIVPCGSTLLVAIGATVGKCALLTEAGTTNQQLLPLVPQRDVVGERYLAWMMRTFTEDIRETAPNTTLPIMSAGKLGALRVPVPDLVEQAVVVERLDREAQAVQGLSLEVTAQRTLLHEHKQALITAVVTGQKEVA